MSYNATVYETKNGEDWGTFVAEVHEIAGKLQMVRSNAVQCTGHEGKIGISKETGEEVAVYDLYMRLTHPDSEFRIVMDNCQGYKNRLMGMNIPPTYKAAIS